MTFYHGSLNVLQDGQGSVIPITLNPSDIPSDGLTIDVSSLVPPNGEFGYIAGLTVDATGANVAAGIISIYFAGGSNVTRNANGGNTQVYKASGPCQQITLKNLAWTTGPIIIVLWNSPPANELQSPLTVVASGSVAISGTPTVQFAPGQSVNVASGSVAISGTPTVQFAPGQSVNIANITTGSVTFTNSQINIDHGTTNLISAVFSLPLATVNILPAGTVGVIRSIDISVSNIQGLGQGVRSCTFEIRNGIFAPGTAYYSGFIPCPSKVLPFVDIISLSVLGLSFNNGLGFIITTVLPNVNIDNFVSIVIGYS